MPREGPRLNAGPRTSLPPCWRAAVELPPLPGRGLRPAASVLATPQSKRPLEPFEAEVVRRLASGTTEKELCAHAVAERGFDGLSRLYPLLSSSTPMAGFSAPSCIVASPS